MKKYIILIVFFVLIFSYSFYYFSNIKAGKSDRVIYEYIANFDEKENVSGFRDNIFIGKVLKINTKTFWKITNEFSEYEVEIIDNIKGNLNGKILVTQDLSYDILGYKTVVEGMEKIEKGNIYIFATSGDKHLILSHKNGVELLIDGQDRENLEKVNKRKNAYINEVYTGVGGLYSKAENAYKNLSETEKEAFKNKEFKLK